MKTIEEKLKLLEETAKFYTLANRCIRHNFETGEDQCRYYLSDKPGCAIGRLIEDKELCKIMDTQDGGQSVFSVWHLVPDYLKEYGLTFLAWIQALHDDTTNWTDEGLSKVGKIHYMDIKVKVEKGDDIKPTTTL